MKRLVIIFLLLSSTVCWGKWTFIVANSDIKRFVDVDTIKRAGDSVYAWILTNFDRPFEGTTSSATHYYHFDCNRFGVRKLEMDSYKEKFAIGHQSSLRYSKEEKQEWHFYPPSSITHEIIKFVCSYN